MLIVQVSVVLRRTVSVGGVDWRFDPLSGSHSEDDSATLKMTTAKGVETSVNTTNTNSPSQDYTNLDD